MKKRVLSNTLMPKNTSLGKFIRVMKGSLFLFFFFVMSSFAENYSPQNVKVTINNTNITLNALINEIENQTTYLFVYNKLDVDVERKVSVLAKDKNVIDLLKEVFSGTKIHYHLEGMHIILTQKSNADNHKPQQALQQSGIMISGTISDKSGLTIPGATVIIKEIQGKGTVTDIDGKYSMTVPHQNSTLIFACLGYNRSEIKVGDKLLINVVLEESSQELEEVIVIGYGSVKKKDLTGSVVRVNTEKYKNQAKTQVTDMLAGTVAGFYAQQSGDAAGGVSNFEVRGPTSLKASTQPLIVLDGVIYNGSIADINPNDVETVDILKDASSTAVYGSRAAAGVMIISTKKGGKGKPTINFSAQIGLVQPSNKKFKPYDAEGFLDFRKDAMTAWFPNTYPYYYYNPNDLPAGVSLEEWRNASANPAADNRSEWGARLNLFPIEHENFMKEKTVDWNDLVLQTGLRQSYDVSIGGGTDNINYYWSAGYDNNETAVTGSGFTTVRTRLNSDYKITNWLTVGINAQFADRNESANPVTLSHGAASPYGSVYDDQGKLVWNPTGYQGFTNPFLSEEQDKYRKANSLFASLFAHVTLPFGLKYELNFQPRYENIKDYNFWGADTYTGSITYSKGYGSRADYSLYEWTADNIVRWNKKFNIHNFDVTLLYSAERSRSWNSTMAGETFAPNSNLGWHALQQAEKVSVSNSDTELTSNATMARINYTLLDKYLITASVRRDGYSGFGKRNRQATFPAVAVAWRISEENFFRVPAINGLKLRLSWGINGNRGIGQYSALGGISSELYFDGTNTTSNVYNSSLANPNLKWERTEALNVGLDLALFNNRIMIGADVYNMTTTDLLMDRRLPELTGFSSVTTNLGKLGNKGLDLTITSVNVNNKDLNWQSSLVFSMNRNKIKELFGDYGDYTLLGEKRYGELPDYNNSLFPGQAIDRIWGYEVLGIWQTEEADLAARYNLTPGDFKSKDFDDNGKYEDKTDKQFIGYTKPRFRLGLSNDLTFLKHFTASLFLRADLGHMARAALAERDGGYTYNRLNEYEFPYWTPENRNNEWSGLKSSPTSYGGGLQIYKPVSFLRIQDVSLSYNLPENIIEKIKLNSLRVYFSVRNLYCFTDWMGWDPESLNYPMPRTYTFGVNISL